MDKFDSKNIILDSHIVNYYVADGEKTKGPILIFIHGWGVDATSWSGVIEKFLPYASRIFAVDLPGFGKSENPKHTFDVGCYTDIMEEFIKKLNIKEAVLIGHSFGGRIALRLSIKIPKSILKSVLVSSAGIRTRSRRVKILKKLSKIMKLFFGRSENIKEKAYKLVGSDYQLKPELKDTFRRVINEEDTNLFSKVSVPTLLLWGEVDKITPLSSGKRMNKEIKNSEIFIIPDVGHFIFLDEPEIFVRKIIKFIS